MQRSKRKYRTILSAFFGLTVVFVLYHVFFSGSPEKHYNDTSRSATEDREIFSTPTVTKPTHAPIISGAELDSVVLRHNTAGRSWSEAYPKPAFHPFNSLALKPTNKTEFKEEQYTIIMLTYKRSQKMLKSLENLVGLPKLNKIIIVWNAVDPPGADFPWPKQEVPMQIVHPQRNSLNNRFLPLDIVETDAILSLDDDIYVSHEDVLFAFSVWQDHRNRIVGFPGRGVRWNTTSERWDYEAHPCTISLVLTGYAFLHKMYLPIFTHQMPESIRERIQNTTNCEDIAMNFLVSHISQTAPIKVTPKNEWECPSCKEDASSLWKDPKHFEERTDCINFFVQEFGYMPLFKSEYRADDLFEANDKCTARSDLNVCKFWNKEMGNTTVRPNLLSPAPTAAFNTTSTEYSVLNITDFTRTLGLKNDAGFITETKST